MSKSNKKSEAIKVNGELEEGCAERVYYGLIALQSFTAGVERDILDHLQLTEEEYNKLFDYNDSEIEKMGNADISALNYVIWASQNLERALKALEPKIGKPPSEEKHNPSYR